MKLATSFLLVLFTSHLFACELKEGRYVSLSGPVSVALQELGLDSDSRWVAKSIYHPKSEKFKGEVLSGGLFLAKKTFDKYNDAIFFYDEARELSMALKKAGIKKVVSFKSSGKDVFEVTLMSFRMLEPYLKNCDKKIFEIKQRIEKIKNKIIAKKNPPMVIFALGPIKDDRLPELLIVNDGVVLTLKKYKAISTYPSELAYVRWSQKILSALDVNLFIGLDQDSNLNELEIKRQKNIIQIKGSDILLPGLAQIKLLEKILTLLN